MTRRGRWPLIITFLLPGLALYTVFVLASFVQGIQVSFTNWSGYTPNFDYVGLANYRDLLTDASWWQALTHNVILLVLVPVLTLGASLFLASMLTRGGSGGLRATRGSGLYRVLFFLPQVIPMVIIGIIFRYLYDSRGGLVQGLLDLVGLDLLTLIPNGPLGNPDTILLSVALAAVWSAVGFYMVLFLAGMGQVPGELYEAAALDGAGRVRSFFHVTLPLIWSHIRTAMVYLGIGTLDSFALVSVLAHNGTDADFGADVMSTLLYRTAFTNNSQFGYASAMGVMMMLASVLLALLTFRLTRREDVHER